VGLIGYMLLIFAAILGAVVIACFYIAMWLVAIVVALGVFAFRLASGQRGDQLWRRPWTPHIKTPAAISQMRISDRR
jgi:hypothetical protein